jgi:hypothetical protein
VQGTFLFERLSVLMLLRVTMLSRSSLRDVTVHADGANSDVEKPPRDAS